MEETRFGNIDLFKSTERELINEGYKMINKHSSDIVSPEMMRRLKCSIEKFNRESSKYSKRIFWLTICMMVVALLQLVLLSFQMYS